MIKEQLDQHYLKIIVETDKSSKFDSKYNIKYNNRYSNSLKINLIENTMFVINH